MGSRVAPFLLPDPYVVPGGRALVREASLVPRELTRAATRGAAGLGWRMSGLARFFDGGEQPGSGEPVLLVPGFLAGDCTLLAMHAHLRSAGFRTYRAGIRSNVSCVLRTVAALEERLEGIAEERGRRVTVVGHSLGGMIARGLGAWRPDLVDGVVTLGSPMLAPGAHVALLGHQLDLLVRLSGLGLPSLMSQECVAGVCAREAFEGARLPLPEGTGFTAVYSRNDGIVDWRACIDPAADPVRVGCSHIGMAFDESVRRVVAEALVAHRDRPARAAA